MIKVVIKNAQGLFWSEHFSGGWYYHRSLASEYDTNNLPNLVIDNIYCTTTIFMCDKKNGIDIRWFNEDDTQDTKDYAWAEITY